ncbi:MAG: HAMP domain-containing sensor histidine kinase [Desulfuromonadaceae bacterium]|nr:HAMP domain-containing sensor histidine kinase [Desulfuromonadaceae bacterium]
MKLWRRIFHPVMALIAIQLVWITLVIFWIYWFVGNHREFKALAENYRPELLGKGFNWPVMVQGLVMLVLILVGVYVIFVFWNRQSNLYSLQRNFISQVTHELKSPLASIQLHLETIRLRRPTEERLDSFVGTMLSDTERLHYLINNLLMAARLEQRRKSTERRLTDITDLIGDCVEQERLKLPQGGSISLDAEPGVKAFVDPEEMGMVLRNLFENAVLYSPGSPDISIKLTRSGNMLVISVIDHGRGIEKKDQKRIFDMFYRAQPKGDYVRGTGLGLYIVESVIKSHAGTVQVASDGHGRGSTFTIKLPAV